MTQPNEPNGRRNDIWDGNWVAVVVAWLLVVAPLAWGIWTTLKKVAVLFQ